MHTYRKTLDAHTLHKHTFSRSLCKYVQSYHINIIILKPCVYYPCGMPLSYQISSLPTNSSVVTMECAASRSSSAKKIRPWRSSTFRFSESFRRAALPKVPAVVEQAAVSCTRKKKVQVYSKWKLNGMTLVSRRSVKTDSLCLFAHSLHPLKFNDILENSILLPVQVAIS